MNMMKSICKWLACNFVNNFCVEEDSLIVCGYDTYSCTAVIAVYNEHGVPICHLVDFDDDWDDDDIERCEPVNMLDCPFPFVESIDNAFKLFSISGIDPVCAAWFGGQNLGFNVFDIDGSGNVVEVCE